MNTAFRFVVYSVVVAGLVICPGCGGKSKVDVPKTYPVSIKIAYRGQPVEGANVTLVPQAQSGRGASGVTDARTQPAGTSCAPFQRPPLR